MPVETAYQTMLYYDQTFLCTEWVMCHLYRALAASIPAVSASIVREFNSAHHNLAQMRAENEKTLLFANEPTDGTQLASAAVSACPVICEVTDNQDHDHICFFRINVSLTVFTPTEWKWEISKGIFIM